MGTTAKPPVAPPCVVVIFGAGGDLTKRKLIPALYNLAKEEMLSPRFALIGIDRSDTDEAGYRDKLGRDIK